MEKNDFSELVKYLDEQFEGLEKRMDNLNEEFRTLQTSVDAYAHKADAYFQEMVMLSHKVDRLERWILQLAENAHIQLKA